DDTVLARAHGISFPALGADFVARNAWRAGGRAVWTEKLPSNFLLAGLIARALPQARFVHVWRPPMDVCFANLRTLYGGIARYSCDPLEMAAWHRAYAALMAHWRAVLGERLLDVAHGELLRAPEALARRLLAHCGRDGEPRVLALAAGGAVSTASAAQVRQGLRRPAPPDWLPHAAALAPMAAALAAD